MNHRNKGQAPLSLIFGIVALMLGLTAYMSVEPRQTPEGFAKIVAQYVMEGEAYLDGWYDVSSPEVVNSLVAQMQRVLDKYEIDMPDHKKSAGYIFRHAAKAVITSYKPGETATASIMVPGYDPLIAIVPINFMNQFLKDNPTAWVTLGNGTKVFLPASATPDIVLAGILCHELGHAELGLAGRIDTVQEHTYGEEAVMHKRDMEVQDAALGGAYKKALRGILKKGTADNVKDAMMLLTKADFGNLDMLFGCPRPGRFLRDLMTPDHVVNLGIVYQEDRGCDITDAYKAAKELQLAVNKEMRKKK